MKSIHVNISCSRNEQEQDKYFRLAEEQYKNGSYSDAAGLFQSFLDAGGEKGIGLLGLGKCQARLGQHEEALKVLKESAELARTQFGPKSFPFAACLGELSDLAVEMQEFDLAENWSFKSAKIVKDVKGEGPIYGVALRVIGGVFFAKGEFPIALKFYEKSLILIDQTSLACANLLNDISATHQEQHNLIKAMEFRKKSLECHSKIFGSNHPSYAVCVYNLGRLHYEMRGFCRAAKLFRESYVIFKSKLGIKHDNTRNSISWLKKAELCVSSGQFDRSELAKERYCENCGVIAQKLKMCSGCSLAYYCSSDCQLVSVDCSLKNDVSNCSFSGALESYSFQAVQVCCNNSHKMNVIIPIDSSMPQFNY